MARTIRAEAGLHLVYESDDPWTALDDVARLRPDVAIVDPSCPGRSDEEVVDRLARGAGSTRVVVLTARAGDPLAYRAVAGGAAAVLEKNVDGAELCRAVDAVCRGRKVLAPKARRRIVLEVRASRVDHLPRLAERERQVLAGLSAGLSGPQIARRLELGAATVKTYRSRLYAKLGVSDRAAAVAQAMRVGLLE